MPIIEEQRAEPRLIKVPIAHGAAVDMQEARTRVPADAAAFHPPRSPHRVLGGRAAMGYVSGVSATIAGGTSEIQRGIIATRGLGLPRG